MEVGDCSWAKMFTKCAMMPGTMLRLGKDLILVTTTLQRIIQTLNNHKDDKCYKTHRSSGKCLTEVLAKSGVLRKASIGKSCARGLTNRPGIVTRMGRQMLLVNEEVHKGPESQ